MGRSVYGFCGTLAATIFLGAGCGPTPAPEPPPSTNASGVNSAKVVFMVLPGSPETRGEFLTWSLSAQKEAGEQGAIFRASGPPTGSADIEQIEAIRASISGGASALVVVPFDLKAVRPVLAEVEAKGIPVVTLGASGPSVPPLPGTAVVPEPFSTTAPKLVKAVIEDAAKAKLPADPPTIILYDKQGDLYSADRVEALKTAAREAGLTHVELVGFQLDGQGEGRTEALRVLTEWVTSHPETAVILAEGDEAMAAASRYRGVNKQNKPYFVAGYIGYRGQSNPNTLRGNSAFVEGKLDMIAKLALRTAVAQANGEKVEPVIVMPTPFNRSIGEAIRDETILETPKEAPKPIREGPGPN